MPIFEPNPVDPSAAPVAAVPPVSRRRLLPGGRVAGLAAVAVAVVTAMTLALGGGRPFAATAQSGATATPSPEVPRTLSVTGRGTVRLTPDTASVTTGVVIVDPSLAAAQREATTRMDAVIQAARDAGVAEADIQTINYSVEVLREYDRNGNFERVTGYQVSNQVVLTVRALDSVGALLDAVVGEGANDIYGISFFVDDPTAAASQARTAAVEDARTKADEMAAAAGTRVVGVLQMTESSSPPPMPVEFERGAAESDTAAAAEPVPIAAGTSEVAVDVAVVFEIAGP